LPESDSAKLAVIVVMVMFIIAVMLVMVITVIRTDRIPRTNRMDRSDISTGLSKKLVPAVSAILAMFYTWYGMDYSLNLGTEREQLRN
jgi:uncharacterized membrane protein